MFRKVSKIGVAIAATAALAAGGGAVAGAASNDESASQQKRNDSAQSQSQRFSGPPPGARPGRPPRGKTVTGENAEKAKAAVLAKFPNASIQRVEEAHRGDGYVVLIKRANGRPRPVFLNAEFEIQAKKDCGPGLGGPPPMGPPPSGDDAPNRR